MLTGPLFSDTLGFCPGLAGSEDGSDGSRFGRLGAIIVESHALVSERFESLELTRFNYAADSHDIDETLNINKTTGLLTLLVEDPRTGR